MRLFIYSTQPEINSILHDHFSSKGFLCITFSGLEEFFTSLEHPTVPPELMILDYVIYNHDIFNIYTYLESKKLNYPCIFYNDPCLTRTSRKSHWKAQINLIQNKNNQIDISKLEPVFDDLQSLIENKQIAPSIKLMQKTTPLPKEFVNPKLTLEYIKEMEEDGVETFRKRNNLQNSLYYLLKLLQKHQNLQLTVSDIKKLYEKDMKEISESSLYVMLSKLRGIVRKDRQKRFIIRKEGEYYKFIKFTSKMD